MCVIYTKGGGGRRERTGWDAYHLVDAFVFTPPAFLPAIFSGRMITILGDIADLVHT